MLIRFPRRNAAALSQKARRRIRRDGGSVAAANIERLEERWMLSATPALGPAPTAAPAPFAGYTPAQIISAYQINQVKFTKSGSGKEIQGDGSGETIAIVDSGYDPNIQFDLWQFDQQFSIAAPPQFKIVASGGGTNFSASSGFDDTTGEAASEIALDVEWAHAIAPGASILLVNFPGYDYMNSQGNVVWRSNLADAATAAQFAAAQPGVVAVSMSFGSNEGSNETQYDNDFTTPAGHAGVTFVASTGDIGNGILPNTTPEYPASSPNVLAVGGTSLDTTNLGYGSETAWDNSTGTTGGGISGDEPEPTYQETVQSTGKRELPDVAFDADQNTGVQEFDSYDPSAIYTGTQIPISQGVISLPFVNGGTSLGAPSWAAMVAIADQGRALNGLGSLDGRGQTLPIIYSLPSTDFHDIISDNNRSISTLPDIGPGYDLMTGRGTPNASLVIPALAQTQYIDGTAGNETIQFSAGLLSDSYTVNGVSYSFSTRGVNSVIIGTAAGDQVDLLNTDTSVTVIGVGADTVNVGNNGNTNSILGQVLIDDSSATVNIDDQADTASRSWQVQSSTSSGLSTLSNNAGLNVTYQALALLNVNSGSGANTFTIGTPAVTDQLSRIALNFNHESAGKSNTVTVDGSIEADEFDVNNNFGPNATQLTLNYHVDTALNVLFLNISGEQNDNLDLNGQGGGDQFTVQLNPNQSVIPGLTTTIVSSVGITNDSLTVDGSLLAAGIVNVTNSAVLFEDIESVRSIPVQVTWTVNVGSSVDALTVVGQNGGGNDTITASRSSGSTSLIGGSSNDTFNISGLSGYTLDGGNGSDTYNIQTVSFARLSARNTETTINDSGTTGIDTLNIDDSANDTVQGAQYTVSSNSITRDDPNSNVRFVSTLSVNYSQMGAVTLTLGSGNNAINLNSTADGTATTIVGTTGTDAFTDAQNVGQFLGALTINGGTGPTSLALTTPVTGSFAMYPLLANVLVTPSAIIQTEQYENFRLGAIFPPVTQTISYSNLTEVKVGGPVALTVDHTVSQAPSGSASGALAKAAIASDPNRYEITAPELPTIDFDNILQSLEIVQTGALEPFVISGTPANLTTSFSMGSSSILSVQGTTGPLAISEGAAGIVDIGSAAETLNSILGSISITGTGNQVPISVDDSESTAKHTYSFTANATGSALTRDGDTAGAIAYAGTGAITLLAGSKNNTYNIEGMNGTNPETTIYSGGGKDTFTVSPTAQNLDNLQGILILNGAPLGQTVGNASLTIDDQSNVAGSNWFFSSNNLSRLGASATGLSTQIYFPDFKTVTINGGAGNNTFAMLSLPASPSQLKVNGGAGTNTLVGPNIVDTWNLSGSNAGTLSGLTFSNIQNLTGGTANDTFAFSKGATVAGVIDAGGGFNTLDYSAYTSSITVNLATGAATGLNGGSPAGVTNIDEVVGGSGNDTLTGDAAGNVLIGGPGKDTIIGGSGRSVLIGGSGKDQVTGGSSDDILIGGSTIYDDNAAALAAVFAEWQSADSYATRIGDLKNGGGLNGTTTLVLGTSVLDDGAANTLTGNEGNDWFFQGAADTIADLQSGETVN
jgi:hypothetical protein